MTDLAVSALIRKRAELAGEQEQLRERLDALRQDLVHLDATIRLFDPGYGIAAGGPKRPPSGASPFVLGGLTRAIFDALRTAQKPLTIAAITLEVMAAKGFDAKDRELLADIQRRVARMVRKKANGVLRRVPMDEGFVGWSVAP